MSTNSSKVLFEMRGDIAVITLNDPDRRNALSRQIVSEAFKALELSTAAAARAIVIASNGPTFCAGANIDDLKDGWMERTDPSDGPCVAVQAVGGRAAHCHRSSSGRGFGRRV